MNKNQGEKQVYLLKAGDKYKIGVSKNIKKRINALQGGNPNKIELIASIKIDNPESLELYLHRLYKDKRCQGEWFDLSYPDISFLSQVFKADNFNFHLSFQEQLKELSSNKISEREFKESLTTFRNQ